MIRREIYCLGQFHQGWNLKTELVELEGVGQFPQKLNYFPRNIYTNEDSFTLRVSDSRKFDEIQSKCSCYWDDDEPYISQLDKISLYEGTVDFGGNYHFFQ